MKVRNAQFSLQKAFCIKISLELCHVQCTRHSVSVQAFLMQGEMFTSLLNINIYYFQIVMGTQVKFDGKNKCYYQNLDQNI